MAARPWVTHRSHCGTSAVENPRKGKPYDMRASSSWIACLISTWLVSVVPASALAHTKPYPACERTPSSAEISGAKGAYEAGQASFNEADYSRAILYWEDAFRRDCTAVKLLLNLARAYELSGKKEHAVLALETYLERRPDAPDRAPIEKRIENLRVSLAEGTSPASPAQPEAEPRTATQSAASSEAARTPESDQVRPRPAWPVILTASAAVLVGVGAVLTIDGISKVNSLNCPANGDGTQQVCDANPPLTNTPEEETQRAFSATTERNVGIGVLAGGGALLAVGGVAWYLLWQDGPAQSSSARARTTLVPLLGPGLSGLSLRGRF